MSEEGRKLNLTESSFGNGPQKSKHKIINYAQSLRDLMLPKNDGFLNVLKANNISSMQYLFERKNYPGGTIPRIAAALVGGVAMFMQGQYSIDHEIANYGMEYRKVAGYNVSNFIFSNLNSIETVFDFSQIMARREYYKEVKDTYGDDDRRTKNARKMYLVALIWNSFTSAGLIVCNVHFFKEHQLMVNMINQGLELTVERMMLGTSVWSYINDISKVSLLIVSLYVVMALMFGTFHRYQDIGDLEAASFDPQYLTSKGFKNVIQYNNGSYSIWDNKKGGRVPLSPEKKEDQTKLGLIGQIFQGNFFDASIERDDVVAEMESRKLHLYTIKTQTGVTVRLLSLVDYTERELLQLSTEAITAYQVGNISAAYRLRVDEKKAGSYIAVPENQAAEMLEFTRARSTKQESKQE